ncbi:MAG: ParB/RepB/Spo0J family partition protein, partial [Desulfobulbaceae bacterium]|nr:ParB/RepB/Spo0J family partition protein [Desulfobulbaceae bacterium]
MSKKLESIPLSQINPPEKDQRDKIAPEGIEELADSMKKLGLLQPILLRRKNDVYEIEAGHRRFLAGRQLNWPTIEAIVLAETEDASLHLERAHENLIREDLGPLEEARLVNKLVYEDDRGVEKTAALLSKSRTWVENRLDILQFPEDIQRAIEVKHLSVAVGRELSKVKDDEARSRLIDSARDYGISARVAKQWAEDVYAQIYFEQKEILSESGSQQVLDQGAVRMACKICTEEFNINVLRHVWLCPDCIVFVR